jgi:hypothetical protein
VRYAINFGENLTVRGWVRLAVPPGRNKTKDLWTDGCKHELARVAPLPRLPGLLAPGPSSLLCAEIKNLAPSFVQERNDLCCQQRSLVDVDRLRSTLLSEVDGARASARV